MQVLDLSESVEGPYLGWYDVAIKHTYGSSGASILNNENEVVGVTSVSRNTGGVVYSRGPLMDCNSVKWIYDVLQANPSGTTDLGDQNVCLDEDNCVLTMC